MLSYTSTPMTHALLAALPCFATARPSAANRPRQEANPKTQKRNHKANGGTRTSTSTSVGFSRERKDPLWQCVQGCGACCKLEKGPTFPSPEEVFDDPSDIQLYKSLIGPDGWCVNYEKETRTCAIYADRPYFCRVEPEIFQDLYGIDKKKFNKEACSCCVDTIKAIYGSQSQELDKFNHAIRSNIAE